MKSLIRHPGIQITFFAFSLADIVLLKSKEEVGKRTKGAYFRVIMLNVSLCMANK
jgi:hypothetical protein